MAQQNPVADQLEEQDKREKLAEELRRAERNFLIKQARFDPQAFLTESQSGLGTAVDLASQQADRTLFERAQQGGFQKPVQGRFSNIGAPVEGQGFLPAAGQAGLGTLSDLGNLIRMVMGMKRGFQGGAVTRPGGLLEQLRRY